MTSILKSKNLQIFVFSALFFSAGSVWAWAERGHHMVCEVATRLVQTPALHDFLKSRGDMMGHVCNTPDIYWKDLAGEAPTGNAAHFMDPESGGFTLQTVPNDLSLYLNGDLNSGDNSPQQKADRMGTLWWRAQQIYDIAVADAKKIVSAPTPIAGQEQLPDQAYNAAVFSFESHIGVLGHFIGDSTMPFHTTSDYDGQNEGHNGLHGFYEGACVDYFDFSLADDVMKEAQKNIGSRSATPSAFELIKEISIQSNGERAQVLALDKILSPAKVDEHGVKTPVQRDTLDKACPPFHDLIVTEIARAAVALAQLWDQAYLDAGSPVLNKYRMYLYPFTPDFVPLDYVKALNPPPPPVPLK